MTTAGWSRPSESDETLSHGPQIQSAPNPQTPAEGGTTTEVQTNPIPNHEGTRIQIAPPTEVIGTD